MIECSTCHTEFDPDEEGMVGEFGIIPVAFCATCRVCVRDLAEQEWDLVPRDSFGYDLCKKCQEIECECNIIDLGIKAPEHAL